MEQLKLNMIPNGVNPVFHASQYDKGRQIRFVLDETLSGAEVTTLYRAKDGTEHGNVQMSVSGNTITDTIPEEVLTDYGIIEGEVNIDGIGSLNFFVEVEKDAYDGGVITTQTASGPIATFETNIETAFVSLKSEINPVQDLHGYSKPWSGGGGKNKLNYEAWKTTGITRGTAVWENNGVTITATSNDAFTNWNTSEYPVNARVPISEGETITLSWKETTNKIGLISIFPNGTTTGMVTVNNRVVKKATYTATSGITFVTFRFGVANSGDTIAYKNIQIEKGSTATAYEPYENICPISGFSALNVTRTGKNLFDNSLMANSKTVVNGDTVTLTATGNFQGSAFAYMPVKQGYKYALNIDTLTSGSAVEIRYYNSAGTVTNTFVIAQSTIININDGTTVKISIVYGNRTAGAGTFVLKGFNIALGEEYQSYEPYNGQTATVNFGQTVYGGVADVTNGKVNKTHGFVNLGDLSWSGSNGEFYSGSLTSTIKKGVSGHYDVCISDTYNAANKATLALLDNGEISVDTAGYIQIKDTSFTSASTFKSTMTSVQLVYELATPTEITTTPENLTAISGENNVYGDTNGDTTVEYYIEV